jgi:hypothetical protein
MVRRFWALPKPSLLPFNKIQGLRRPAMMDKAGWISGRGNGGSYCVSAKNEPSEGKKKEAAASKRCRMDDRDNRGGLPWSCAPALGGGTGAESHPSAPTCPGDLTSDK